MLERIKELHPDRLFFVCHCHMPLLDRYRVEQNLEVIVCEQKRDLLAAKIKEFGMRIRLRKQEQ